VTQKVKWTILLFSLLQWHCIQSYVSPYKSPATGYLVVEGYITGNGPTSFLLTRSIPLPGDSAVPVVTGAQLQVEGSDNSISPFTEVGNGYYLLPSITMSPDTRYRLRISNVNNETYLSDYVPYKPTPPIDSVNWIRDGNGVTIYGNTHDPTGNTRYYQWKFSETWEYRSAEESGLIWRNDSLVYRLAKDEIYTCYHFDTTQSIFISSSDKLAQDVIYRQPLVVIPNNSQTLEIEYSMLVSQYALTDSAYNFLSLMKGNTEQLGSIFDNQPSQITGNIHSLSNPGEMVIGYVGAGSLQQQRVFISIAQLPNWFYFYQCPDPDHGVPDALDSEKFYYDFGYTPVALTIGGSLGNYTFCVDCRAQGGTTNKPSYWPN
jgi:hypothetical protein